MQLTFRLSEEDFIQAFLYHWSTDQNLRSKRRRNTIILAAFSLIIGFICFWDNITSCVIFFFLALILNIFYPFYVKVRIENTYRKFIRENYKEKTNILQFIEFKNNSIKIESELGDNSINYSAFQSFIETKHYYYLNMKTSDKIIVPKNSIQNNSAFKDLLHNISDTHKFAYIENLNWKF